MHERSLVRGLLELVAAEIAPRSPRSVRSVQLDVGEFAGIEPLLLQSAFEELAPNVLHPEVTLDLSTTPLRGRCRDCAHDFLVEQFRFVCPQCNGRDVQITGGEDLILTALTLETEETDVEAE